MLQFLQEQGPLRVSIFIVVFTTMLIASICCKLLLPTLFIGAIGTIVIVLYTKDYKEWKKKHP